jgi:hypothetical protein
MKTVTFRVTSTLTALVVAIALIMALAYAGDIGRGPLEHLFSSMGNSIRKTEARLMIQSRTTKRSDKLQWLQPYVHNAALLQDPDRILLGAFDNQMRQSLESIVALEDSLASTFPLIQLYTAWGDKPDQEFPVRMVEGIFQAGSIPVITWEPWLTAFESSRHPHLRGLELRDKKGMKDVASGAYDFYIRQWARGAKAMKKTIFIRPGHEMNDPYRYPWGPQNNTPEDFVAAWRHMHAVFAEEQVHNVLWIWSPHPAYGQFDAFYPGDSVVDYVGINTLNYGTVAPWSQWWSFSEVFGKFYKTLAGFNKPVMLTELGSLEVGGSRSEWFAHALDSLPQKYPAVKAVLFFHYSEDNTTTQQALNWYVKDDTATTHAIRNSIAKWGQVQ